MRQRLAIEQRRSEPLKVDSMRTTADTTCGHNAGAGNVAQATCTGARLYGTCTDAQLNGTSDVRPWHGRGAHAESGAAPKSDRVKAGQRITLALCGRATRA